MTTAYLSNCTMNKAKPVRCQSRCQCRLVSATRASVEAGGEGAFGERSWGREGLGG